MHTILWEFTVREEHLQDFISAYGADGDWAKLFRRAEGYSGTQLLRSADKPNAYLTIDRWESKAWFDLFKQRFGGEYVKLDARCEGYTVSETLIGIFSEVSGDEPN